jgi:hypothetical protein
MTPEQHAEFEAFTAMKMAVHREMFPHTDKIIEAMKAGQPMIRLTTDSAAPRFKDAAEANAAFEAEVLRRWSARKTTGGITSVCTITDVQRMIDQFHNRG